MRSDVFFPTSFSKCSQSNRLLIRGVILLLAFMGRAVMAAAPTLTTVSTLPGATEDTALTITYATLAAAADEADGDGDTLSFRVEAVSTGTLTKSGSPVVAGTTLLGTGESLGWTPAANANGIVNAFTIKAWDGTTASATAIQVQVTVTAVNDAPSFALPAGTATPAGATWTARDSNRGWYAIASSADGTKLAAVVLAGQIYTSVDSGANWTARESSRNWGSIASSADGTKLAAVASGGQIYTSIDSGATWTARESIRNWRSIASSADGTKLAAVAYGSQIYTSTDSGATWTARGSNRLWTRIASSADGTKLAAAVYGGQIYTSIDSGATWTPGLSDGNRNWWGVASSDDGTKLAAVAYAEQIYTSEAPLAPYVVTVAEDAAAQSQSGFASSISAGPADELAQTVSFTVTNNVNALFSAQPAISAAGTLTFTPAANANGTATVTVTMQDSGGTASGGVATSAAQTFTLTLSAVNDAPTLAAITNPAAILEDAGAQTVNLTGIAAGGSETQVLTVTATSNNTGLIPNPTVTYTSAGATGSLSYTPVGNANGTAIITVTVTDNGGTADSGVATTTQTFTVAVTAVNDAPTLAAITNPAAILEDASGQTVSLTGIAAGGGETQVLTVTATSNNTSLIPNPTVTYTSAGTTGSLSYTPVGNANGTALITVTVTDNGGTTNSGVATNTRTFTAAVTAVNDVPTLAGLVATTTAEDTATAALAFTIGDVETAAAALTVTATSSNTTLIPNANLVFGGTGAARTLTATPALNQFGTATITATVNDGTTTTSDTFVLTVTAVNDAPTLAGLVATTTAEDTATAALAFTIGDIETAAAALTVTATSSNTVLVPNAALVFGGTGAARTLTATPALNEFGTATITVTVNDGTTTTSETFVLTVTAVNDAPTITDIADTTIAEDGATSALSFTLGDVETAAAALTVTATSSNTTLIPNANLVFGGTGASRTLTATHALNEFGTATITVTVNDGTTTTSGRVGRSWPR